MARPTSTPYAFCTTTANRIAASAAQKLLGFAGGTPVPAGVHNDLFGIVSEWVTWFSGLPVANRGTSLWVPLGFLRWNDYDGDTVISYGIDGEEPSVTATLTGGTSGASSAATPMEGGRLTAVGATITVSAGSHTVTVSLINGDRTVAATFSQTYTTSNDGSVSIPAVGTPAMSVGPCWLVIDVTQAGTDGDTCTIADLTLTFAAD